MPRRLRVMGRSNKHWIAVLQVSDLDRQILAAQELLGQAALTINKAESKAGKRTALYAFHVAPSS